MVVSAIDAGDDSVALSGKFPGTVLLLILDPKKDILLLL